MDETRHRRWDIVVKQSSIKRWNGIKGYIKCVESFLQSCVYWYQEGEWVIEHFQSVKNKQVSNQRK